MKVFLRLSFVGVRKLIFRPLQSLQYLNLVGINFSISQWPFKSIAIFQKSHNISERFFCARKQVEVGLKFSIARDQRCYVSLFLWFLKVSRLIFTLDTFGRQADKYITCGGMFFYVFMYLCLPIWTGLWMIKIPTYSSLSLLIRSLQSIPPFFWCIIPYHVES